MAIEALVREELHVKPEPQINVCMSIGVVINECSTILLRSQKLYLREKIASFNLQNLHVVLLVHRFIKNKNN